MAVKRGWNILFDRISSMAVVGLHVRFSLRKHLGSVENSSLLMMILF